MNRPLAILEAERQLFFLVLFSALAAVGGVPARRSQVAPGRAEIDIAPYTDDSWNG
jgi:hypothetical protein